MTAISWHAVTLLSGKCMTGAIGPRVVGDIDPERNTAGSSESPAGRIGHRSIERPGRCIASAPRSGGTAQGRRSSGTR
jgi:hypothetical protein